MSLRVLSPGTHSLVVDAGRPSTRGLGVPVGGPADQMSLALGNALVGSLPFAPALEITLTGPTLVADADVGLCVFGAPFRIDRDGEPVEPNATFTLRQGQTLHIGGTPTGVPGVRVCARRVPGGGGARQPDGPGAGAGRGRAGVRVVALAGPRDRPGLRGAG